MASAIPVSGSTYSYAYATLGELVAMVVAACLLLEYGVSTAAVAVGWSGYLNELLDNLFGFAAAGCAASAAPWDTRAGIINLPAVVLVLLCMLLLIRGASESAKVNAIMVVIKLAVLVMFVVIAFTAFNADNFADFAPLGVAGIGAAAGTIFFSFIGLDAVSTAGEEVKDPQKTMPRAIMRALFIVTPSTCWWRSRRRRPAGQRLRGPVEAGLAVILENITGDTGPGTILAARRGDLDLLGHPGDAVRPDPHPVRDGPRRDAAADASPRSTRAPMTPVNNTIIVAIVVGLLAGFVPPDYLWTWSRSAP